MHSSAGITADILEIGDDGAYKNFVGEDILRIGTLTQSNSWCLLK